MRGEPKPNELFIAYLVRDYPQHTCYKVARLARDIMALAASHHRQAENLCNIPDYQAEFDKQTDRIEARINAKLAEMDGGIKAVYGGDPRGATVKLEMPSGVNDSFGGEGLLCVPAGNR